MIIQVQNPEIVEHYATNQFVERDGTLIPVYFSLTGKPKHVTQAYFFHEGQLWPWDDWFDGIKNWFKSLTPYLILGCGVAGAVLIFMAKER